MKEFTEILTRKEKRVFISFPREERARCIEWLLARSGGGLSLLLSFKGQRAGKGVDSHLFWSTALSGLAVSLQDVVFWRTDLPSSVISQFLGVGKRLDSGP